MSPSALPIIATMLDHSGALTDADFLKRAVRGPMYTPEQRDAHKALQKKRKEERRRKRDQRRKQKK